MRNHMRIPHHRTMHDDIKDLVSAGCVYGFTLKIAFPGSSEFLLVNREKEVFPFSRGTFKTMLCVDWTWIAVMKAA